MKKILVANSGGLDSALICRKLQADGYEVHSLFINSKSLGWENAMVSAKTTADNFCASHKVISIDWGYTPNNYENADSFIMYDDAHAKWTITTAETLPETANNGEAFEVTVTDVNGNSRQKLYVRENDAWTDYGILWSGPANLGMVIMSVAVSYAKTLGINEVCGGFAGQRSPEMYDIYNQASEANLSLRWRPKYIAPYGSMNTIAALSFTGYAREDFPWVVKSVPQGE